MYSGRCPSLVAVWLSAAAMVVSLRGQDGPLITGPPTPLDADSWRLTWQGETGARYRLERSFDLLTWNPVDTITALGPLASLDDTGSGGAEKVFWRVVQLDDTPEVTTPMLTSIAPDPANPGQWTVTWTSTPGVTYVLERSFELIIWEEVGTIDAIDDLTSLLDTQVAGEPRAFWRVKALEGGGGGLVVGDVAIDYQLDGPNSSVTYTVLAGGDETIAEVNFLQDGTPLGSAQRSFGDSWSLVLDWDPDAPRALSVEAEVVTAVGTTRRSEPRAVLLANPGKFVPISTDGEPLYGQLIPIGTDGLPEAFAYYPEGLADPARSTGVHFEFGAGTTLEDTGPGVEVTFADARFYRGPGSPPAQASGISATIDLNELTPDAVGTAFDLPLPIDLDWGASHVTWRAGALGEGGWRDLQIDLPIGDFALPGGRLAATVGADPESGELFLTACYFGTWSPQDGGPAFRIPEADPLKIYLTKAGGISAHGTAEAEFPNGALVRGTISWSYLHFEFRFEGKGIVIPALDTLQDLLPDDPLACTPSGNSAAELDEFARCLEGYRASFRGLAQGGATQADTSASEALPALPTPTDAAGSALEAWAGRIRSWPGDRSGEVLTDLQIAELQRIVVQSNQTAAGAHDLATTLKLYRDILTLQLHLQGAIGAGTPAAELVTTVDTTQAGILASVHRILDETPVFESPAGFSQITKLAIQVEALTEPPPPFAGQQAGLPPPILRIIDKKNDELFPRYEILPGDTEGFLRFGPEGNPHLESLSRAGKFSYLREVMDLFTLLTVAFEVETAAETGTQYPIVEGLTQLRRFLLAEHNTAMAAAMAGKDYHAMRSLIIERTRILADYAFAGLPIGLNEFDPSNVQMLVGFEDTVSAWLPSVDARVRNEQYNDNLRLLIELDEVLDDEFLDNAIQRRWLDLNNFNKRFINQRLALGCDGFLDALTGREYVLPDLGPEDETSHAVPLTGKYESIAGTFQTLQLNQAGRYLTGFRQVHHGGRFRLRGHILSDDPGMLTFAVLDIVDGGPDDGRILGDAILTATIADGTTRIEISDPTTDEKTDFVQTSQMPPFSRETSSFFQDDLATFVTAFQQRPFHTALLRQLKPNETERNAPPRTDDTLFKRARTAILSYKINENNEAAKPEFANQLNDIIGEMLALVDEDAHPALRLLFLQELAKPPFVSVGDVLNIDRTFRDRFMMMLREQEDILMSADPDPTDGNRPKGKARILMGPDFGIQYAEAIRRLKDAPGFTEESRYHYILRIESLGISASAGAIGLGALDLDVTIEKYNPGNETYKNPKSPVNERAPDRTYQYDGWLAQGGIGRSVDLGDLPGLPASIAIGTDETVVDSPFDYQEEDFEGPILLGKVGATLSFAIGLGVAESFTTLYGRGGDVPALYFDTGDVENPGLAADIKIGAGFEVSAGRITSEGSLNTSDDLAISTGILTFNPVTQAEFDGVFDFKFASAELSDCGRQYLRELVADHRALLGSHATTVLVLGFTDTTGSEATNKTLSEARANAVRDALLQILGPNEPRLPADRIVALGLGERPALDGFPLDSIPTDHWIFDIDQKWRPIVYDFGNLHATIPDGTDEPLWRRVVLAVNGVVSVKMNATITNN